MPYTVFATNEPDRPLEVDEAELVDLQRMGLLVYGKGDVSSSGRLKRQAAADAPVEVVQSFNASPTTVQPPTA